MDSIDFTTDSNSSKASTSSILPLPNNSPPPLPAPKRFSNTIERISNPAKGKSVDRSVLEDSSVLKGKGIDRSKALVGFDDTEEDSLEVGSISGEVEVRVDEEEPHCAICLSPIENKTSISPCQHSEFCFICIRAWTDQSRRCPLCLGAINHLEYNRRSSKDYQIHHLLPLPSISSSDGYLFAPPLPSSSSNRLPPLPPRHALYGRNSNSIDDATWRERAEERAIERRAYIYREKLFAKHIASNIYTKFKPFTPQSFSTNSDLKARVIKFVRRELQVFPSVDVVFLTTYVISIASQLDLRSASAIRLLSDFLNEDDAEHFSHEVCTFARSSFSSLEAFDRNVQYPRPERPDEAILNAVNGGRISNSNGQKTDGRVNQLSSKPYRYIDKGLLNENNRYASVRNDQNGKSTGRRGSGGQSTQDDYFRSNRGRNSGRFSNIDRYVPGRENGRGNYRSRSRSRSRSRNDRRGSDYSNIREKDQSKIYSSHSSNSRSPSPARSRRISSRSRSRSRSRSYSPAPRSRSQTPTHDDRLPSPVQALTENALASISNDTHFVDGTPEPDALSFTLAPESELDFELTPLDRSPQIHAPTGPSISIFGAAKRRSGPSTGLLQRIQKPLSQNSSSTSVGLLGRLGPIATSSAISSADDNSSQPASQELIDSSNSNESDNNITELPISDLKTKLQDRLMAEYRTALANKESTSAPKLVGDALRLVLHERLRSEKSQSDSALRERVIISRKRHLEDQEYNSYQQEEEFEEEEEFKFTAITWNADTRALLLARLEEEKSRTNGIDIEAEKSTPVINEESTEVVVIGTEESLRLALSQRRKSSAVDKVILGGTEVLMEDRASELRRKLKQRRLSVV